MEIVSVQGKGETFGKVVLDEDPINPRKEFDNMGTMVCFHGRYSLGDDNHGFSYPDDLKDFIRKNKDKVIGLPLYLYDHSGITMNTEGFTCPWDSGQVGWIYVEKEKVRKEYNWKLITAKRKNMIMDRLRGEVEIYDKYLRGEVYGVIIEENGEEKDSCWGFFGIEEANNYLEEMINN